jgi:hypothetical protein
LDYLGGNLRWQDKWESAVFALVSVAVSFAGGGGASNHDEP